MARAQANYMRSFNLHNLNITAVAELSGTRRDEFKWSPSIFGTIYK